MDWIEFNNEATKFDSDRQYLKSVQIYFKFDLFLFLLTS